MSYQRKNILLLVAAIVLLLLSWSLAIEETINLNDDIAQIEKDNAYQLTIDGQDYQLTLADFVISAEDIPGWLVANDADLTVALDISLTDDLKAEGMARELVNRIQNVRKTKDFNVTDRIKVALEKHELVTAAVESFGDYIKNEVLADDLSLVETVADGEAIELPEEVTLGMLVELN